MQRFQTNRGACEPAAHAGVHAGCACRPARMRPHLLLWRQLHLGEVMDRALRCVDTSGGLLVACCRVRCAARRAAAARAASHSAPHARARQRSRPTPAAATARCCAAAAAAVAARCRRAGAGSAASRARQLRSSGVERAVRGSEQRARAAEGPGASEGGVSEVLRFPGTVYGPLFGAGRRRKRRGQEDWREREGFLSSQRGLPASPPPGRHCWQLKACL